MKVSWQLWTVKREQLKVSFFCMRRRLSMSVITVLSRKVDRYRYRSSRLLLQRGRQLQAHSSVLPVVA